MFRHRSIQQLIMPWLIAAVAVLSIAWGAVQPLSVAQEAQPNVPALARHPLPPPLEAWVDDGQGDYFDEIEPIDGIGYLIWSRLPTTVYIEPPRPEESDRAQIWFDLVRQAVEEWAVYLPMELVTSSDANITIWRDNPSIQANEAGQPRARSAEARYRVYVETMGDRQQLAHQMTVIVRPGQPDRHLIAAARHELGHALGIWGHSPDETDALYFSQVRHPPSISARDVSTLKRVYEQPTRLGWPVRAAPSSHLL